MSTVTAYLRVSTDRQTLENQRSEISRFALSHGMKIDSWVEEIISGKVKDKDRKLGLLLKRLKKGGCPYRLRTLAAEQDSSGDNVDCKDNS